MDKEPERNPRKALGRGLSALLPPRQSSPQNVAIQVPTEASPDDKAAGRLQMLAIDSIQSGSDQPRKIFDEAKIRELADSIRSHGLIQPITVYKAADGAFKIVAGERRWRAARIAGLTEIPAIVRELERHKVLELALIENLQREDLNPIEVAQGFHRLTSEYGLTHEQIAERTSKDRSTVTNFLRLLKLAPLVQRELAFGKISMGHARALLNITNPSEQFHVCDQIISKKLSVRETETLVKKIAEGSSELEWVREKVPEKPLDPNVRAALEEMEAALGTKVRLVGKADGKGRLEIEFYSQEDLERIYSVIVKQAEAG